jgi:FimV-like protein
MEHKLRTALIVLIGLNASFTIPHAVAHIGETYVQDEASHATQETSPQFGQSYRPAKNQTLWNISKRLVKNTKFSIQQGVDAIVAKNPQAFRSGNAHQIKKDVVLSLPTREEMGTHPTADTKPIASSDYDVYVNHAPSPSISYEE